MCGRLCSRNCKMRGQSFSSTPVGSWLSTSSPLMHIVLIMLKSSGKFFRHRSAHVGAVHVSIHSPRRLELVQPVEDFQCSEISRMPNLVPLGEVREYSLVHE